MVCMSVSVGSGMGGQGRVEKGEEEGARGRTGACCHTTHRPRSPAAACCPRTQLTSRYCTMLVWPDRWRWFRISRSTFRSTCIGE